MSSSGVGNIGVDAIRALQARLAAGATPTSSLPPLPAPPSSSTIGLGMSIPRRSAVATVPTDSTASTLSGEAASAWSVVVAAAAKAGAAAAAAATAAAVGGSGGAAVIMNSSVIAAATPPLFSLPTPSTNVAWPLPHGGLSTLASSASVAGFPSGVTAVPTSAGQSMNLTSSAAAAAALLGPGGLAAMLSAFTPTRVLVILNAISDGDLLSGKNALSDILADCASEAQSAITSAQAASTAAGLSNPFRYGGLLRAVTPLPRIGETLEPRLARARGAMRHMGADGLLEDGPQKVEFDVSGGGAKAARDAAAGVLIIAPDVAALGALGRAPRNKVASAAADFFIKVGGGFSDNVSVLDMAGRSKGGLDPSPNNFEIAPRGGGCWAALGLRAVLGC